MPWGAAIGGALSLAGQAMSSDKNGGAGSSSNTKEPWAGAQPWILSNIARGQDLQRQRESNPFSDAQINAYGTRAAQSDFIKNLLPSLMQQSSQQPLGFNRGDPNARVSPYNFDGTTPEGGSAGLLQKLLADLRNPAAKSPARNPIPVAPAAMPLPVMSNVFQGYNGDYINPNAPGGGA